MKKILIVSHTMELGGAERALLGLLNHMDFSSYAVDLFLERQFGELLGLIPPQVRLLPEKPAYASLGIPVTEAIRKMQFGVALGRLIGKRKGGRFIQKAGYQSGVDVLIHYSHRYTCPWMPKISDTEYDLVISFLTPHYFAAKKTNGRQKIAWIHTDYQAIETDRASEETMWAAYDRIVSISPEVTAHFAAAFPALQNKIVEIYNMHPQAFIRAESLKFDPADEMPEDGSVRLLSIGRYCIAKNFENVPFICKSLIETHGLNVKWYIIGYGTDEALIRKNIQAAGMEQNVILLGKKENPYPYMRRCDFYVQPSRFEGNAVTVNEALILRKKVILTDYDTAKNQVENGVDGVIVPLENEACADGMQAFIRDAAAQQTVLKNVQARDYSNAGEIQKLYALMGEQHDQ